MKFPRGRKWLLAPLSIAALALGACSSDGSTSSASSAPESTSAPASETASPSESEAPSKDPEPSQSTPADDGGKDDGDGKVSAEVQKAIDDFIAKHEGAQEIPASQLEPQKQMEAAQQLDVKPAECKEASMGANNPELLKGAVPAGAMHVDQAKGNSVVLMIMDYPSADAARNNVEASKKLVSKCPKMEISMGGQKATNTQTMKPLDGLQGADEALQLEAITSLGEGAEIKGISGIALKGELLMITAVTSPDGSLGIEDAKQSLADALAAIG